MAYYERPCRESRQRRAYHRSVQGDRPGLQAGWCEGECVFDYPISVPRDTLYARLGIPPEATMAEVQDAKGALVEEIGVARRRVEKRLAEVDEQVAGLAEARSTLERAINEGASDEEKSSIRSRLNDLERKAEEFCPEYRSLRREQDDLHKRLIEINGMVISDPKGRADYDLEHPPLSVLRLTDCGPDLLGDHPDALPLLRAEISRFLEDKGETVFHPTDVTRRDFSGDLTHTPLLDGEER